MILAILGLFCLTSFPFIQGQTADPVKVSVFYESLCPYSREFFVDQLTPTYNDLKEIMLVESNAYGNANEVARTSGDGYVFSCQHGPDECYGNKILACGQEHIEDHDVFLNFNFCVMGAEYPPTSAADCAAQVGVSADTIINCANSTEGENLLHNVGVVQSQLDPPLTYVPWIIINDHFSELTCDAARANLKRLVCNTYEGEPPAECATAL